MKVTKAQWEELEEYVEEYVEYYVHHRRTMGVWWNLAKGIEAALNELRAHRDSEKTSTYTFNPHGRRSATRAQEERGGGRRKTTRGKKVPG